MKKDKDYIWTADRVKTSGQGCQHSENECQKWEK